MNKPPQKKRKDINKFYTLKPHNYPQSQNELLTEVVYKLDF